MNKIIEQLQDFCDCLPRMSSTALERNVSELIDLISSLTGWKENPGETFLNSERSELIELGMNNPGPGNDGIVEFVPYYQPFNPESFRVCLIGLEGACEGVTELDSSEFHYGDLTKVLRINLKDYLGGCACSCAGKYRLVIKYDAGYESIPEYLLTPFCDLLHVIADKNNCNCSGCQSSQDEVYTDEFDDDASRKLDTYLKTIITAGYKQQLGLISLYGPLSRDIWGVIV